MDMISYKPLWKTLIDRDLSKKDFRIGANISTSTMTRMGRNEYIALRNINDICEYLDCSISDVIEFKNTKNM